VVEQQVDRVKGLVERLKELRGNRLYPIPRFNENESNEDGLQLKGKGKGIGKGKEKEKQPEDMDEKQPLLEELPSSSSTPSRRPSNPTVTTSNSLLPIPDLTHLSTSLKSLTAALSSTSTTRTSLLTSLESYTSHLHREIYLHSSTSSSSGLPVGLGTLGANLREAGTGTGTATGTGGEGKNEWDEVRKEVRAMKGMLLGRRSFGLVNGIAT